MPVEVILPKVDMDMTHGTLAVWHVAEGEMVVKGAALFDIETDKAAMEVEAPASGRLTAITAKPGDRVAVGSVIALILADGEVPPPAPAAPVPAPPAPNPAPNPAPAITAPAETAPTAKPEAATPPGLRAAEPDSIVPRATPAARAAARKAGFALAEITGTGPLGRIQRDDVPTQMPAPETAPHGWAPQPGPLSVRRRKGDGPTLVMLHGFTADNQSWAPLEKAIGPGPALIRIDMPCHGKSPLRRITGFASLARMMVEAFDEATGNLGAVHLIGHSLGGALAIAIADIRPRRVASLNLIAPAGLGPEIDAATLKGITRATRPESLAPWLRRLTADPDIISDSYAEAAMRARSDAAMRAAQADMADAILADGTQTFDVQAALHRLTAPTRIIWGRQDRIIPCRHATAQRTDAAIHLLDGAGHIPQMECPDRVARVIGLGNFSQV